MNLCRYILTFCMNHYFCGTSLQEGFWYHHAEPNYLMLVHWIAESANTIPANATHRVGVGALVVNEKGEVYPHYLSQCIAAA